MTRFSVTDVVDMDVALHGKRFIVAEFAIVAALAVAIAIVSSMSWARVYAALFALNCMTFAWLAVARPRRERPALVSVYVLTGFAIVLLFLPLLFPLAAALQRRRS